MADLAPHIGSRRTWSTEVRREHTVPALPIASPGLAAMPEVLATPMLVAMAECACAAHLASLAGADLLSLGTEVQIAHAAATPVGADGDADHRDRCRGRPAGELRLHRP